MPRPLILAMPHTHLHNPPAPLQLISLITQTRRSVSGPAVRIHRQKQQRAAAAAERAARLTAATKRTPSLRLFTPGTVVPPYPFGPTQWFKQSKRALYGGSRPQFGNRVSGPFGVRTRRVWRLNSQRKKLFSTALNRFVRVRLTVRVLRSVDRAGGLDEYLLADKPSRVRELGPRGWALRWRLLQVPSVQAKMRERRVKLGWSVVDPTTPATSPSTSIAATAASATRASVAAGFPPNRSPEALARADLKKLLWDPKKKAMLGSHIARWRIGHVLYMRRLTEARDRKVAELAAAEAAEAAEAIAAAAAAEAEAEVAKAEASQDGTNGQLLNLSSSTNAPDETAQREIELFDKALDEEDEGPDWAEGVDEPRRAPDPKIREYRTKRELAKRTNEKEKELLAQKIANERDGKKTFIKRRVPAGQLLGWPAVEPRPEAA